ncbi:unnamed protein product [Ceutorhynchus assimilis]|uniref:SUEL-type lectin domain-containing protein n=1 Tax=Ceutorhynchus assimilis TaxID=467358 RepID=A0A9N9QDD7_9CUCU|nr:unnamed protein product [Ceutorhynchus assimilis]
MDRFIEEQFDEFRSKVACENERIQLKCNPNSRVAVYSASYGRTQYESIQCPQPQGVPEETCLASYATETVMQLCHGKRNCDLAADIGTFGSPCKPQSRMYLKVVYTCVPRRVLKDQYEGPLETDESDYDPNEGYEEFDNYDTVNEHIRESAASPPVSKLDNASKNNFTRDPEDVPTPRDNSYALGFVSVRPAPMGTIAQVVRYPEYPDYPQMHSHSHTFRGSPSGILESEIVTTRPVRDASTSQYYYG